MMNEFHLKKRPLSQTSLQMLGISMLSTPNTENDFVMNWLDHPGDGISLRQNRSTNNFSNPDKMRVYANQMRDTKTKAELGDVTALTVFFSYDSESTNLRDRTQRKT